MVWRPYLRVQKELTAAPLPAPGNGDTTPVTVGDLYTASLLYLSAPNFTPGYFPALAAAAAGNGAPLRSVALGLENDLNGESLVGPLWTITCSDVVTHPDARQTTARLANTLADLNPMIGAEAVFQLPRWVSRLGHLRPTRCASRTARRADPTGDRERLRPQHPVLRRPEARCGNGWTSCHLCGLRPLRGCSMDRRTTACRKSCPRTSWTASCPPTTPRAPASLLTWFRCTCLR